MWSFAVAVAQGIAAAALAAVLKLFGPAKAERQGRQAQALADAQATTDADRQGRALDARIDAEPADVAAADLARFQRR